jgi:RND family efflux transporter, MFP subunit
MKGKKLIISIAVLLVVVIVIVLGVKSCNKQELIVSTEPVAEGTLEITVMTTGYVQPVEEVEVGTQVSGVIEKIYVDYNSQVTQGQLLAELDKSTLQERVNQAKFSQQSAQSAYDYALQNYNRTKRLFDGKAATAADLESAENSLKQTKATLDNTKADLSQAQINLSYANIYSPINGVILDRSVNTGQTVAASFSTPTLFTIAEDMTKMQVEADIDEADIGQIKLGQKVSFYVDAYYNESFEGTVSQIRLQPTTTNNVVTYTVIIDAPNPEEKLLPGMTANITVTIEDEKGLLVPVGALNFKMTPEWASELGISNFRASTGKETAIWIKKNNTYERRVIQTGMNDGVNIIVKSGVEANEEVLLSLAYGKKDSNGEAVSIMPTPPRRR